MRTKERLLEIDIARGISIVCIILGHLNISWINKIVYTFHVPIFYFISGFFFRPSSHWSVFVRNKIRTLLVPYCFTSIIIILLGFLINLPNGIDIAKSVALKWLFAALYGAGSDDVPKLFVVDAIGAIWFLLALFWGSLLFRGIPLINKRWRVILPIILFAIGVWSRQYIWLPFSIQAGLLVPLYMYVGYLVAQNVNYIKSFSKETTIFLELIVLILWVDFIRLFDGFYLVSANIGKGITDVLGSICGCIGVICIAKQLSKKRFFVTRWLSTFGRYSIIMLCIHLIEMNIIPWREWATIISMKINITEMQALVLLGVIKILLITTSFCICIHSKLICKIFGITNVERKIVNRKC